jgi:hypothetical protein
MRPYDNPAISRVSSDFMALPRATAVGEPEYETTIRAKWTMDGARTLAEAAQQMRTRADLLDQMAADGWELEDEVADDYGHCIRRTAP